MKCPHTAHTGSIYAFTLCYSKCECLMYSGVVSYTHLTCIKYMRSGKSRPRGKSHALLRRHCRSDERRPWAQPRRCCPPAGPSLAVSSRLPLTGQASRRAERDPVFKGMCFLYKMAPTHRRRRLVFRRRNALFFQHRSKSWRRWTHRFPTRRLSKGFQESP